jgi:hypothetical protein
VQAISYFEVLCRLPAFLAISKFAVDRCIHLIHSAAKIGINQDALYQFSYSGQLFIQCGRQKRNCRHCQAHSPATTHLQGSTQLLLYCVANLPQIDH